MIQYPVFWVFCVYVAILSSVSQAELRDPTMPSGFYPGSVAGDASQLSATGLDLQAIFYNPVKPAAIINGLRFSPGDQVADAIIKQIYADRVVLSGAEGEWELKLTMPTVKTLHQDKSSDSAEGMK